MEIRMCKAPSRLRYGFTITELLVVVAIIALSATLLFPVLARQRDLGWRTACMNNVRQLSIAHRLYVQDWDGHFPAFVQSGPPRPAPFGPNRYWTEFLAPYLRSTRVLRCPGAVGQRPPVYAPVLAEYALLTWAQGGRRDDPEEPY
jgi:prepilin-type N-terminal cleavage/methylation domain-containing protein